MSNPRDPGFHFPRKAQKNPTGPCENCGSDKLELHHTLASCIRNLKAQLESVKSEVQKLRKELSEEFRRRVDTGWFKE